MDRFDTVNEFFGGFVGYKETESYVPLWWHNSLNSAVYALTSIVETFTSRTGSARSSSTIDINDFEIYDVIEGFLNMNAV